jgi:hypothetical protein
MHAGVLYWRVETVRINGADFELGGAIQHERAVLVSDGTDTAIASIGPVEQVRV